MKSKKAIAAAAFLSGTLMMGSCALAYTPGTYDAVQPGIDGDVTIHVTFSENAIESITTENNETVGVGADAIDELISQTLESQSVPADVITGATVSSTAYLTALKEAIAQAGGDTGASAEAATEGSDAGNAQSSQTYDVTEADIIVVGGGAAGMTAAVTAADEGASVILLEKSGRLGGNTLVAANGINAADSQVQLNNDQYQEAGASVEGLIELQEQNDLARDNLVKAFAWHSGEVIDWLSGLGVDFEVSIQEDDRNAVQNYYMLQALADGSTGITTTMAVEHYMEDQTDVVVYKNTQATQLIQNENGRVTGVKALGSNGEEVTFSGKAVLIATGGFGKNKELLAQVAPDLANATTDETTPNTGDGLLMAQAIGAKAVDLDQIQTFPVVVDGYGMVTPNKLPGGFQVNAVIVNENAERFTAEAFEIPTEVLSQPDGAAYMIFREDQLNDDLSTMVNAGFIVSADTARELGQALGLDGDKLQETVDAYNEDIADGTDDAFGKENPLPLEGRLYGFKYGVGAHYFMGGILINENTQVLDEDENIIEGLYAAGEVTGGFHGSQRIDGSGIGDSFTFGRIAGQTMAAAVKAE